MLKQSHVSIPSQIAFKLYNNTNLLKDYQGIQRINWHEMSLSKNILGDTI